MKKELKTFHTGLYIMDSEIKADTTVLTEALNVFKLMPLLPETIEQFKKHSLEKMIFAEIKLEENPASFDQVQKIIHHPRENFSQDTSAINIINIHEAIKMLSDKKLPFTQETLTETHNELVATLPNIKETNGHFRNGGPKADAKWIGSDYIPPASTIDVNLLVKNLAIWMEEIQGINPIIQAALLHLHVKKIQPYSNCNGHLARLLERWILEKNGVKILPDLLPQIYNEKKNSYYKAISAFYATSETSPFITFISENIKDIVYQIRDENYAAFAGILAENYLTTLLRDKKIIKRQYDLLCMLKKHSGFYPDDLQLKKPFTLLYGKVSRTTVSRDIIKLEDMGLIIEDGGRYVFNRNAHLI